MTLALALTDNGNGTGLVATVSGSAGGSTNQLFAARHYDGVLSAAWSSLGTRTGDGTIAGSITTMGDYWLYLVSTLGAAVTITPVRAFRVTNGPNDSVFLRILEGVVSRLQSLSLAGISSAEIKYQKIPWKRGSASPGIFVSPTKESYDAKYNQANEIGYGVQVTTVMTGNNDLTANLDVQLAWRQAQRKGFEVTPYANGGTILMGVPECYEILHEPGPVIDYGSFVNQLDVNAFVLRVFCEEPRGI